MAKKTAKRATFKTTTPKKVSTKRPFKLDADTAKLFKYKMELSAKHAKASQDHGKVALEERTKAFGMLELALSKKGYSDPENWSYNDETGMLTPNE